MSNCPPKKAPESLGVQSNPNESEARAIARTVLRPSVRAADSTRTFSRQFGELNLAALCDELAEQSKAVSRGDMARSEAMLISQAHTLEAVFHELARRAALNMGEYINAAETYMRLALKAQSQCRATLETLATIKNPQPVTIVRQANVAHGPQQVNNGTPHSAEPLRAQEFEKTPNKLLEQHGEQRLDGGASKTAVGTHPAMEAVEQFDRT
jgi:hypothetical protein